MGFYGDKTPVTAPFHPPRPSSIPTDSDPFPPLPPPTPAFPTPAPKTDVKRPDDSKRSNLSMAPSTPQDQPAKKPAVTTTGPAPVRTLFPVAKPTTPPFPKPTRERRQELWLMGEKGKNTTPPLPPSARQRKADPSTSEEVPQVKIVFHPFPSSPLSVVYKITHLPCCL